MADCEDCPPAGYPNEKTRCIPCPRRKRKSAADICLKLAGVSAAYAKTETTREPTNGRAHETTIAQSRTRSAAQGKRGGSQGYDACRARCNV